MRARRRGVAVLAVSSQRRYNLRAWSACAAIWLLAVTPALAAQSSTLDSRLDPTTAAEVSRLMDSARVRGLPSEPLLDKALEGASKHANSQQIVTAVRGLAVRLSEASTALGPAASQSDLVAAAGALYQGVPAAELTRLQRARGTRPLALPLVVLADLIERGVPTSTAMSVVVDVATRGASDNAFTALRRDVESDIAAGAPPAIAATTRARGAIFSLPTRAPASAVAGGANAASVNKKP